MKPRPITKIAVSPDFDKNYSKLPKHIQKIAKKRISWFQANSYDTRLKTHTLAGKLQGLHSFWINREYRILFRFVNKDTALFITIGTHSIYK